jgi:hypothetical protein
MSFSALAFPTLNPAIAVSAEAPVVKPKRGGVRKAKAALGTVD